MVAEIGNCVHMCDKAEGFAVFQTFCGRKMRINIAVIVQCYIRDPKPFQFLPQEGGPGQTDIWEEGEEVLSSLLGVNIFYIG